jgi:hypothetical protein
LRVSDAEPIAVVKCAAFDRNVVDKRAVETLQIENYEVLVFFFDL